MHELRQHFIRYTGGGWLCIKPMDIDSPQGRIQVAEGTIFMPGTCFMNFDISTWLATQIEKEE